ncbi:hypothetical protein [Aquimarina sp. 2201CG5-10]|uniref:hypothetical protein n=1 Tax=Aquimarina callyspongiae TaxID=3098150 RepID=UPI002AB3603F|nr:hypothetical protein [Aquimarina sp. 2201CG5-10]MDY8134470.1 hypothetical protein [Aquimarina sp. 2201CG5-10]
MNRKNTILFTAIYLLINSTVIWMTFNGHLPTHGSINILFSLLFSGILGINNDLVGSLIYLILTTVLFYGISQSAVRKNIK